MSLPFALQRFPARFDEAFRGGVVALGNFDGVHLGHQHVLGKARELAAGRPVIVLSFYPHPIVVLRTGVELKALTGVREKIALLRECGVAGVYLVHFTVQTAAMSAREFIERVLVEATGAADLVVGEDAAIGRGREGDVQYLREVLPSYSISLSVVETFDLAGARASSRRARALLDAGNMTGLADVLGRNFFLMGRVGHGDARGRTIGFPTVNLGIGNRALPPNGVYASWVSVRGEGYKGVTNIGVRPTFAGDGVRVETHLLGYTGSDLYGEQLRLEFVERIRDEIKFGSVDQLREQIDLDCTRAVEILTNE